MIISRDYICKYQAFYLSVEIFTYMFVLSTKLHCLKLSGNCFFEIAILCSKYFNTLPNIPFLKISIL